MSGGHTFEKKRDFHREGSRGNAHERRPEQRCKGGSKFLPWPHKTRILSSFRNALPVCQTQRSFRRIVHLGAKRVVPQFES